MIGGLGREHKAPIPTQFVMIGVLLVIRSSGVLCNCFAPVGGTISMCCCFTIVWFGPNLCHPLLVRLRHTLCTSPLTDWEGYVWGSPSVHPDKGKLEFFKIAISHQFPSHLCSASRGIKIEEAQIPLFQVSLQFSDHESSMAIWGVSAAILF